MNTFKSTYSNIQVSAETVSRASDMIVGNIPIFDNSKRLIDSGIAITGLTYNNGLTKINNVVSLGGQLTGNTKISGVNYNLELGDSVNEINNFNVYGKTSLNNKYGGFNVGGTGFNNFIISSKLQSDGKIIVGGTFTTYNGVNCPDMLVRLNSNGSIDSTFNSGGIGFGGVRVYNVNTQSIDGKILVGGDFTTYNGVTCSNRMVRLNTDGSIDPTFNSGGTGFGGEVSIIEIQLDSKILVGGYFTTYNGIPSSTLVRLNSNGSIDSTFNSGGTGFNLAILALTIQSDGKILVGGDFTTYNGVNCPDKLVRLNTDGSLDTAFNSGGSGFGGNVFTIKIQSNNKIIVGGDFTTYNGVNCPNKLVRLNTDGSIDSTFNSGGTGFGGTGIITIYNVNIQSDNKILVGGTFTTYNGVDCSDNLVRLNSDSSIDSTFNSGGTGFNVTSYAILTVNIQSDNKILAGGLATSYNGVSINNFTRLNGDGSLNIPTNKIVSYNGEGGLRYGENIHDEYSLRSIPDVEWIKRNFISGNSISNTPFLNLTSGVTINASTIPILFTSAGTTIILPNAITNSGFEYTIKIVTTGTTTINTVLSQTIDGLTTKILNVQYQYVKVKSNGTNWFILS